MNFFSNFRKSISTIFTTLVMFTELFCTNQFAFAGVFLQKTDAEAVEIIEQTKIDKSVFLAITEVGDIADTNSFFRINSLVFRYPKYCICATLNGFLDCQRDLRWIHQNKITWIIKGFTSSKIKPISKNVITMAIRDYLIPYWNGIPGTCSSVDCLPHRQPKEFNVYYT